jgi:hypothetical protein
MNKKDRNERKKGDKMNKQRKIRASVCNVKVEHKTCRQQKRILIEPHKQTKQTPWPESARKLYRPRNRRLSAELVSTFADRGCRVVRVTDPYGRILDFLDQSRYFVHQVAPQLYSRD